MELLAQLIGVAAMIVSILSFQCKKNRNLFVMQGIGSLLFAVSYFMLHAPVSAACNLINILRATAAWKARRYKKTSFVAVSLLYVVSVCFTYENPWSLAMLATQIIGTGSMMFGSGKTIRRIQLFIISPMWLINNVFVFAVGGILCEVFTIFSVVTSYIRYRKTGFEA